MYGFMEMGYGYSGKESRIGSCTFMVLWRQEVDTVEKKAELDPVHLWFYGDEIWIQWKRKQNWILYIYGFMEMGYGYSGKESRIGSCTFMVLWRRDMDTVEKKAELDPVHLWFYGDRIWIQWKRKQNWILYIYGFMEMGYGYSGKESRIGSYTFMVLWRWDMDTVEKKAELDPVHLWFYGDGIWIQWKRKQNWILYIYGFMETGYGYSGKESRIGSYTFMVLWRWDMDTVEKKAELDPVHLWFYGDRK